MLGAVNFHFQVAHIAAACMSVGFGLQHLARWHAAAGRSVLCNVTCHMAAALAADHETNL
jgi:hypothetical protein